MRREEQKQRQENGTRILVNTSRMWKYGEFNVYPDKVFILFLIKEGSVILQPTEFLRECLDQEGCGHQQSLSGSL